MSIQSGAQSRAPSGAVVGALSVATIAIVAAATYTFVVGLSAPTAPAVGVGRSIEGFTAGATSVERAAALAGAARVLVMTPTSVERALSVPIGPVAAPSLGERRGGP